ncbi:hypothetical protein C8R43DRAFT_162421 [Mycena crocata]|nr:hypothetical protein C8R43DRAFT_162421 [Mycena crocata]
MSFSRLPVELKERILKNINKPSIFARYGLVCKMWLKLTRPMLFSCILLHAENVEGLAELLDIPEKATFTRFVRAVAFRHGDTEIIGQPWKRDTLLYLLVHFPHFATLRLTYIDASYLKLLPTIFGRITCLELALPGKKCTPFAHIVEMVCSFPLLEEFSFTATARPIGRGFKPLPELRTDFPPMAHLRKIHLDHKWPPVAARLLAYVIMRIDTPPPLEHLSLVLSDPLHIYDCVRAAGPALRSLSITLPEVGMILPMHDAAVRLPHLEVLRFRCPNGMAVIDTLLKKGGYITANVPTELVLDLAREDCMPVSREDLILPVQDLSRRLPEVRKLRILSGGPEYTFRLL